MLANAVNLEAGVELLIQINDKEKIVKAILNEKLNQMQIGILFFNFVTDMERSHRGYSIYLDIPQPNGETVTLFAKPRKEGE